MNKRSQLESMTTLVADTGNLEAIEKYRPTDATTNPSLILKAAEMPQYSALVEEAVRYANSHSRTSDEYGELLIEKLFVNFGLEILKIVPGRVSTEVDAKLSFDTGKSVAKAKALIRHYENAGIPRDRILIKLASTWEGILAARELEKEGIHCNMTLLFSLSQAIACAEANVTLISPFVGRITDWFKKQSGIEHYPAEEDPGVISVTQIYQYYKHFDYKTEVMGASFRNKEQILSLAGCDLLTISPDLLQELSDTEGELERKLDPVSAKNLSLEKQSLEESQFRYLMNEDAMATEKLAEGIRNFNLDARKLESSISRKFNLT